MTGGIVGQDKPGANPRDAGVVRAIEEEGLDTFTFDGLRRLTGTHPETLSRTLDRLEDEGMIMRSEFGYAVTGKARGALGVAADPREKRVQVLRTYLPYGVKAAAIAGALKGKWFDRMRWLGMAEAEEGVVMKWMSEDGSALIDVKLAGSIMEVDARARRDEEMAAAIRAAYQLTARISRMYTSPNRLGVPHMMQLMQLQPSAM